MYLILAKADPPLSHLVEDSLINVLIFTLIQPTLNTNHYLSPYPRGPNYPGSQLGPLRSPLSRTSHIDTLSSCESTLNTRKPSGSDHFELFTQFLLAWYIYTI